MNALNVLLKAGGHSVRFRWRWIPYLTGPLRY